MPMPSILKQFMAILLVICYLRIIVNADEPELRRRFDYKRSLRKPFFVNGNLPHFQVHGDVLPSQDYLRLAPSVQSQRGSIWSDLPVPFPQWQMIFTFSITGRGRLGGDGLAFWYTEKPLELGKAMGSAEVFDGLMLAFDTYDNDAKRDNPTVYGILNDNTKAFDPETDGSDLLFASCSAGFRNSPMPTWVRVTNAHGRLKVEIDINSKGKSPVVCFDLPDIILPTGYYFGFSSATGGLADDHDLISVEMFEIDPPQKVVPPRQSAEPPPVPNQEQFERIQEQVQEMRAKHEVPFEVDENYKNFLGKLSNVDDLLSELSYLANSQREIRQLLDEINHNTQNLLRNPNVNSNPDINNNNPNPIPNHEINQISLKLNEVQNILRSKLDGTNLNIGPQVQQLQTSFENSFRQLNDRLQRIENNNPTNLLTQVIREEIAKIGMATMNNNNFNNNNNQRSPNNNNNNNNNNNQSQSDEGVNIWVIVIAVVASVGLVVYAGVKFFTRKSNPKKFI